MRRRNSLAVTVALAAMAASERRGAAAARAETALQESVFDEAEVDSPNLTILEVWPQRLLVVAVATGNLATITQRVTWNGHALAPLQARSLTTPAGPCRLELWMLLDPPPGTGPLVATQAAATAFGVGAVVYSGVDHEAPFGPLTWQTGSSGRIVVDLAAPGDRPVLGAACLGGAWATGPTMTTPEAVPGYGEDELWNFTEPHVVGLGSHRSAMNGRGHISWDVTGGEPYEWLAVGLSVKPEGEVLPDAGPDAEPDALAAEDAGGDGSADRAPFDGPGPGSEEDGGADAAGVADVHLRVGCACDTGRSRPVPGGFLLLLLVLADRSHRRNSR